MKKFFNTLLSQTTEQGNEQPIYIIRYEDLVSKKKETLMGLLKFMLCEKDLDGTNAERRVDEVVRLGLQASQSYQLKKTTGKFNAHMNKYSPELKQYVQTELADLMYYFGYTNVDDNPVSFFNY